MSTGETFDIVTRIRLATDVTGALRGAELVGRQIQDAVRATEQRVSGLESTLHRFGGAFAGFFAVDKILEVKHVIFESLAGLEQMQLGVAGVLKATGAGTFVSSIDIAKQRLNELFEIAKRQVGTFEQYAEAFNAVLQPVRTATGDSGMARDLVTKLLPVFHAFGGTQAMDQAGYSIRRLLVAGEQGMHTSPAARELVAMVKGGRDAFNVADPLKRIRLLLEAAGKFEEMVRAGEATMDAQTTTLRSNLLAIGRTVGEPLFEGTKENLKELNKLLEENRSSIEMIAKVVGLTLVDGIRNVTAAVKELAPILGPILLALGGASAGKSLVGGLAGLFGPIAGWFGRQAAMAELSVGVASGSAALGMGAGAAVSAIPVIGAGAAGFGVGTVIGDTIADARMHTIDAQTDQLAQAELRREGLHQLSKRLGGDQQIMPALAELLKTGNKDTESARSLRMYAHLGGFQVDNPLLQHFGKDAAERLFHLLNDKREARAAPQHPPINMHVIIKQDFKDVQDPDRIATLTAAALKKLAVAATQSRRALPHGG